MKASKGRRHQGISLEATDQPATDKSEAQKENWYRNSDLYKSGKAPQLKKFMLIWELIPQTPKQQILSHYILTLFWSISPQLYQSELELDLDMYQAADCTPADRASPF